MTQKNAQIIFIIFNILTIFAVGYVIYDIVRVQNALSAKEVIIHFDTGVNYYLLMTIFFILSGIQYAGLKNEESKLYKNANKILVFWFIFILIFANLISYYIVNKFEVTGYTKCSDSREISRVAKGESSFYTLGSCQK